MEDVYTIKVKTKPDSRNLYPSERRYSASTVSGLAWVHVALAATCLLLACLTIVGPQEHETKSTESKTDSKYLLVAASSLVTVFGSTAGLAGALASARWYESHHISRFLVASILSTAAAIAACCCSCYSLATMPNQNLVIVKHADVVTKNESHFVISLDNVQAPSGFTERVMAINILIAAVLELLWSLLSVKISFKGMKNDYKDKETGNQVSIVTKIKGNDDILPSKFQTLCLKDNQISDSTSECYRERIMNFLNKCTTEASNQSVDTNTARECNSPASWGDTDQTMYNQNTINFDKIFTFNDVDRDNRVIDA